MTTTPRPKPGPDELFTDPRDDEFWEGVRRRRDTAVPVQSLRDLLLARHVVPE